MDNSFLFIFEGERFNLILKELLLVALLLLFGLPTNGGEATLDNYLITLSPEQFQKLTTFIDMEYNWTLEDIYNSALMVQTECGSLGEDCYLSVMSTAYGRFKSPKWCQSYYCSKTISEEIFRPGQFIGPIVAVEMYGEEVYDIVRPESYLATYKFILGFRGTCSDNSHGYEYFNSYVGGPVACKIESDSGSFMEFFSTEAYQSARDNRNVKTGFYSTIKLNMGNSFLWSSCGNTRRYDFELC